MRECNGMTGGQYIDRGPALRSSKHYDGEASEVVVRDADGVRTVPAYDRKRLKEVIQQGRKKPRPLTHDETEMVDANRRRARDDLAAMEAWYRAELKEPLGQESLSAVRGGPVDETLEGITLGDTLWKPITY